MPDEERAYYRIIWKCSLSMSVPYRHYKPITVIFPNWFYPFKKLSFTENLYISCKENLFDLESKEK